MKQFLHTLPVLGLLIFLTGIVFISITNDWHNWSSWTVCGLGVLLFLTIFIRGISRNFSHYVSNALCVLFVLITLVGSGLLILLFRKGVGVWDLTVGSFLGWTVLTCTVSLLVPGASYMLIFPLAFSMIPVLVTFLRRKNGTLSPGMTGLFLIFALPAVSIAGARREGFLTAPVPHDIAFDHVDDVLGDICRMIGDAFEVAGNEHCQYSRQILIFC